MFVFFTVLTEVLLILFVAFVSFGLMILIPGIFFWIFYKRKRNLEAWRNISRSLGLTMPPGKKLEMRGTYKECPVRLATGVRRHGSGEDSSVEYFTYCEVPFPNSLRLLLNISGPKGFLSNLFGSDKITIGNDFFDKNFNARCYAREVLQTSADRSPFRPNPKSVG